MTIGNSGVGQSIGGSMADVKLRARAPFIGHVLLAALLFSGHLAHATLPSATLATPLPSDDPMRIDFSDDPVLGFAQSGASADAFRAIINRAIESHASVQRAAASERQAAGAVQEAHAGRLPDVSLQMAYNRRLASGFSNSFDTLVERSRPIGRTDATMVVNERLFDFGATTRRIQGAQARRDQAQANVDGAREDLALDVIATWYDLAAYRALVELAEAMVQSRRGIRAAVEERIVQGVSAQGDLARVDVYIGRVASRLAQLRGEVASAEARYRETTGLSAPARIERPTLSFRLPTTVEEARLASANTPEVRAAKAQERAAGADWRAVRAENLPSLSAQVNAGRYGVFENDRNYDVRGQLVLSHQLFGGGGGARKTQAHEQFRGAQATADQISGEAERDAESAFVTLASYDEQVRALGETYMASRRSRDLMYSRFRNLRGTLFDVLITEDEYFDSATAYLTTVSQRDAQKLALLRRCGTLLDGLGIAAAGGGL